MLPETLPVATTVATGSASNTPRVRLQRPDLGFYVETMGLEATTSCLQSVDRTVSKRPAASTHDDPDAYALPHTAPVATARPTPLIGLLALCQGPRGPRGK